MDRLELIHALNARLLAEMPQHGAWSAGVPTDDGDAQRRLLRALMNVRPAELPLAADFLELQDELLSSEVLERGVVQVADLPRVASDPRIVLWQGDITRLDAAAVVNAANSALLGCFMPGHTCIDNVIHSAAGLQLRAACYGLMQEQGYPEPVGRAKMTPAFNLPSAHVLHTVGPTVSGHLVQRHRDQLAACYVSCLDAAAAAGLSSIAFCCISTGVFRFPAREAAEVAVATVRAWQDANGSPLQVVFDVYLDDDLRIYRDILGEEAEDIGDVEGIEGIGGAEDVGGIEDRRGDREDA